MPVAPPRDRSGVRTRLVRLLVVLALMSGTVGLVGVAPAYAAPANDDFADATVFSQWRLGGLAATGSTRGATAQAGEPTHAGQPPGASVWFSWTADSDYKVVLRSAMESETLGALRHAVAVYTGPTVSTLTPVASLDAYESSLTFRVVRGRTYSIALTADDRQQADEYSLSLSLVSPNALFEAATTLTARSGTTLGAVVGGWYSRLGQTLSIWYRWRAPASGPVTFDTLGSMFRPGLWVSTGASPSSQTYIANSLTCPTPVPRTTSCVTFEAVAGTTYNIELTGGDGEGGNEGHSRLTWGYGGADPCTVTGTAGDDVLVAAAEDDVVCGRGGDDVLVGVGWNDTLVGGPGTDVARLPVEAGPVTAWVTPDSYDSGNVVSRTTYGVVAALVGVENLVGTPYADTLVGAPGKNALNGGDGADTLYGQDGDDLLVGGADDDSLVGGGGTDDCRGGPGTDTAATCEAVVAVP